MPPEAADLPDPGDELIARVIGSADRTWFYGTGRDSVRALERTLAVVDRTSDSFDSILDFGCGCGRMLLWLEGVGRRRAVYGTDVDSDAIGWAQEHIPYCEFRVNSPDPPLPFEDGQFDLVFNHSVFTHIDEHRQDEWLEELRRVTCPGGLVVLTTHGEPALDVGGFDIRADLEANGIVFIDHQYPSDSPFPDWYQVTYHAPWYVFEHWGRWFEVQAYLPGAALGVQDHVLLRRSEDGERRTPLSARLTHGQVAAGRQGLTESNAAGEDDGGSDRSESGDEGVTDLRSPQGEAERTIAELEAQIASMRATTTWRWATRYWLLRAKLRRAIRERSP